MLRILQDIRLVLHHVTVTIGVEVCFTEDDIRQRPKQTDVFDYCPFEPPDPWHESVAKYVDVKLGFK
ncbi:unnamed protein product, partial [Strongylus vulgaris]